MMSLSLPHTHTRKRRVCFNNTWGLCEWNEVFRRLSVTIKCVWLWRGDRDKEAKGRERKTDSRKTRERERETQTGSVSLQSLCLPACRSASPLATLWWIVGSDDTWQLPLLYSNTGRDTAERPAGFTQRRLFIPPLLPSRVMTPRPPSPSSLPRLFLFSHCCFSQNIEAFLKKQHINIHASKTNFCNLLTRSTQKSQQPFKTIPPVKQLESYIGLVLMTFYNKCQDLRTRQQHKNKAWRGETHENNWLHPTQLHIKSTYVCVCWGRCPHTAKVLFLIKTTLQSVFLSMLTSSLFTLLHFTPSFADVIITTTTRGRCKAKKRKHASY